MFSTIGILPSFLGLVVIISILLCKYSNKPKILLLIIVLASIFYQLDINKRKNEIGNYEEIVTDLSKFIIITGVLGYIAVKIAGLFYSGFD